ncbi:hypothetical protein SBRCBS47491_007968 [Sporothrix bragantina]|uniref:Methyltransferase domain-containing protein n=1 Tax=Sporothrix bragantina TaxID=671064 RepID=A0ABP0CHX3_9PEZI
MSEPTKAASQPDEPQNIKARIKASYDAIAPAYNAWTVDHFSVRLRYLKEITDQLRPANANSDAASASPLRVLELGCGAGVPVTEKLLVDLAPVHITANDISTGQLDLAREALGEHGEKISTVSTVDWVEGDMMALQFPDASLDAVLGFYSVIHLPQEEQITILERIGRWLKPGTGLFLANFSGDEMKSAIAETWLDQEKGWMYWSGLGVAKTEATLQGAGLKLETSKLEKDTVDGAMFHWVVASRTA